MSNSTLLNYLSPRRPWLWLIVVLALYTLGGFFLAPWYIKKTEIAEVKERFNRTATLARVAVNPFLLTLSREDNAVLDPDGTVVLSYDRYFMNFQLSSLFNWAWTFSEVRIEGLIVNEERFGPNDSRLGRLIKAGRAHAQEQRSPDAMADNRTVLRNEIPPGSASAPPNITTIRERWPQQSTQRQLVFPVPPKCGRLETSGRCWPGHHGRVSP